MSGASGKAADQVLLAIPGVRARQTGRRLFRFSQSVIAPRTEEKMINPTTAGHAFRPMARIDFKEAAE